MGYESKIFIVRKTGTGREVGEDKKERTYAEKIAEINMCKIGGMPKCFYIKPPDITEKNQGDPKARVTDCYIYHSDGNTVILKDCYGDPLAECTPQQLLKWVNERILNDDFYARYYLLKAMLEEVIYTSEDINGSWGDVVCLHYGY